MTNTENEMQTSVLKSFHDQFALNQNHHQTLFIQFISAVLVVMVGYGIIYSNTTSAAQVFDVTKDVNGSIKSYSITHLIATYTLAQFILVLLGSLILNTGYSFRRDQKVIYNIRQNYLGNDLYKTIFEERSFNPTNKKLIFNSFLPGFNLIFVSFIYFLQFVLLTSLIIALNYFQNLNLHFWSQIIIDALIISPILLSGKYLHHYYHKYKKVVK